MTIKNSRITYSIRYLLSLNPRAATEEKKMIIAKMLEDRLGKSCKSETTEEYQKDNLDPDNSAAAVNMVSIR